MAENKKEFNLSKSRELVKQILQGVYTGSQNHRIIELIFANVETQDKEFIRLLEERLSKTFNDRAMDDIKEIINELAGDALTGKPVDLS